jgi:hypothetical protein
LLPSPDDEPADATWVRSVVVRDGAAAPGRVGRVPARSAGIEDPFGDEPKAALGRIGGEAGDDGGVEGVGGEGRTAARGAS